MNHTSFRIQSHRFLSAACVVVIDKPYHDTAKGEIEKVHLTTEWKPYSIDLAGKDLSRIVTGFAWVVAGQGKPVTFYLDDVRYE